MNSCLYRLEMVENKEIYIVEKHHQALLPWAQFRRKIKEPPLLLTLDHHTDTNEAFSVHSCDKNPHSTSTEPPLELQKKYTEELLKKIDISDNETIKKAILKLKYDEHIDTAIKTGIISKAFVIQYQHYFIHSPENNIYIVGNECYPSCERMPHNNECQVFLFEQAIESKFIEYKLDVFREMCPEIFKENNTLKESYILDIDLDYFHTWKAIHPKDHNKFYELIRNSCIITIALEKDFFKMPGYDLRPEDVDCILEEVLKHIKRAIKR